MVFEKSFLLQTLDAAAAPNPGEFPRRKRQRDFPRYCCQLEAHACFSSGSESPLEQFVLLSHSLSVCCAAFHGRPPPTPSASTTTSPLLPPRPGPRHTTHARSPLKASRMVWSPSLISKAVAHEHDSVLLFRLRCFVPVRDLPRCATHPTHPPPFLRTANTIPTPITVPPAIAAAVRPLHLTTNNGYNSTAPGAAAAAATATASPVLCLHPKSPTAHHQQNAQHQGHRPRSQGNGNNRDTTPAASSDFFGDDDSDDDGFSSEDPDTLYERECSGATPIAAAASSRSASSASPSPSSARGRHAPGAPRREAAGPSSGLHKSGGSSGDVGGFGGGRGGGGAGRSGGAGGDAAQRHAARNAAAKRRSSERFDAVMDTLAAQVSGRGQLCRRGHARRACTQGERDRARKRV